MTHYAQALQLRRVPSSWLPSKNREETRRAEAEALPGTPCRVPFWWAESDQESALESQN